MEYHLLQRSRPWAWWRPLAGVLTLALGWQLVVPVILVLAFGAGIAVVGGDVTTTDLVDTSDPTPLTLAFLLIAGAAAIPASWAASVLFHRLGLDWLSSVVGRLRWRWMLVCAGLSVVALAATLFVNVLIPAQGTDVETTGQLVGLTSTTRDFVLVVVLLTPLQAAGEEYAFRGYLTQAFGGLFRSRWAAVVFPSVLFALAHGSQDAPVFVDRLAFGLVAGVLVIVTGGLEAGIAMHVLNNLLAFGLAVAFGDLGAALNPGEASWWNILVTLTRSLVYLALAIWAARRLGLATSTPPPGPATLEAPERAV